MTTTRPVVIVALRRRPLPRVVLGARHQVAAGLRSQLDVGAVAADVRQRRITPPVLGGGVGVDRERHTEPSPLRRQQPVHPTAVDQLGFVRERGQVPEAGGLLDGGLSEAVVELPPTRTRDVDQQPVVRRRALLVPVQTDLEEVPQQPAGLGHPEGQHVARRDSERLHRTG